MMDAIDVLTELQNITPLFQPIFSADEHLVTAYEVKGQLQKDDEIIDLLAMTQDREIPSDYRLDIELQILRNALLKFKDFEPETQLYVHCNPNLLMKDYGETHLNVFKDYLGDKDLEQIVVVISEHLYHKDMESLQHVLRYFQTYGIKIAIDHVGSQSHIEHLAQLEPNILMVTLRNLDYDSWSGQTDMISAINMIAHKLGASMLFDGIDTLYQQQLAWRNGGRYYQGAYLGDFAEEPVASDLLKERFREECQQFITSEKKMLENRFKALKQVQDDLEQVIAHIRFTDDYVEQLKHLTEQLEGRAFRLYICDGDGFQITPNIVQLEGEWQIDSEAKHKNWSWRPYFLQTIVQMRNEQESCMSDLYSDIETGEMTRTFSMPINEREYVFIDLSHNFLFENHIYN